MKPQNMLYAGFKLVDQREVARAEAERRAKVAEMDKEIRIGQWWDRPAVRHTVNFLAEAAQVLHIPANDENLKKVLTLVKVNPVGVEFLWSAPIDDVKAAIEQTGELFCVEVTNNFAIKVNDDKICYKIWLDDDEIIVTCATFDACSSLDKFRVIKDMKVELVGHDRAEQMLMNCKDWEESDRNIYQICKLVAKKRAKHSKVIQVAKINCTGEQLQDMENKMVEELLSQWGADLVGLDQKKIDEGQMTGPVTLSFVVD